MLAGDNAGTRRTNAGAMSVRAALKTKVRQLQNNSLTSILRKLRFWASFYHTPRERLNLKHVSVGSFQFVVPCNEDIGRTLYYLRAFEPEETRYLRCQLKPDDICCDVGANIGYHTILIADIVRDGKVHAFEPDPLCHALLQLNVQLNRLENVIVNRLALGKERGRSDFIRCADGGFNSIRDTGRSVVSSVIEVPVDTLDNYAAGQAIPRIDFLKVDVEGAEGLVLEGAQGLLNDHSRRPRLLMVELFEQNHKAFGDSPGEIVEHLRRSEYDPFLLSDNQRVPYSDEFQDRSPNVFFSCAQSGALSSTHHRAEEDRTTVSRMAV